MPTTPAMIDAMKIAILAAAKSAGIGKSLAGDEQRHRKADASERTRTGKLPPGIFFRLDRDAETDREPGGDEDAQRLSDDQAEDDRAASDGRALGKHRVTKSRRHWPAQRSAGRQ